MGRVLLINGEYYIEFEARGLPYRRKAGTNFEEAQKLLRQIETQIKNSEAALEYEVVSLQEFLKKTQDLWQWTLHPISQMRCRSLFELWLPLFPQDIAVHEITPQVFDRALKVFSQNSRSRLMLVLSWLVWWDLFDEARRTRLLNDHPMRLLKTPHEIASKMDQRDSINAILERIWAYESPLREHLALMGYQGVGYEEALRILQTGSVPNPQSFLQAPGTSLRAPRSLPWHPVLITRWFSGEDQKTTATPASHTSSSSDNSAIATTHSKTFILSEDLYRRPYLMKHQAVWSCLFAVCCHSAGMRFLQWHRYLGYKDLARSAASLLVDVPETIKQA